MRWLAARLARIDGGNEWTPDQVLRDLTAIVAGAHATDAAR